MSVVNPIPELDIVEPALIPNRKKLSVDNQSIQFHKGNRDGIPEPKRCYNFDAGDELYFLSTDVGTLYISAVLMDGTLDPNISITFSTDRYIISKSNTGKVFNIKVWTADTATDGEKLSYTYIPTFSWLKCDEGTGTVAYDSTNNHNNFEIDAAVIGSFHYEGSDVPYSWQNNVGFTLDTGVRLPRNESIPYEDAYGSNLQYKGKVRERAKIVNVPVGTPDGTMVLSFSSLSGITIVDSQGTSTPSINGNDIEFTAGTVWGLELSNGTFLTFNEGVGNTIYDVSGNGLHGTWSGHTYPNQWGISDIAENYLLQYPTYVHRYLDGNTHYIVNTPLTISPTQNRSIKVRFKWLDLSSSSGLSPYIFLGAGATLSLIQIRPDSVFFRSGASSINIITYDSTLVVDTWYEVELKRNVDVWSVIINGVTQSTTVSGAHSGQTGSYNYIGGQNADRTKGVIIEWLEYISYDTNIIRRLDFIEDRIIENGVDAGNWVRRDGSFAFSGKIPISTTPAYTIPVPAEYVVEVPSIDQSRGISELKRVELDFQYYKSMSDLLPTSYYLGEDTSDYIISDVVDENSIKKLLVGTEYLHDKERLLRYVNSINTSRAQAVFANVDLESKLFEAGLINSFSSKQWALLVDVYWFGADTEAKSLITWKRGVTATNNGATHVANESFSFDGIDDYIESNFIPNTDGGSVYIKNSGGHVTFILTNGGGSGAAYGVVNTSPTRVIDFIQGADIRARQSGGGQITFSGDGNNFIAEHSYGVLRTDSLNIEIYKDGIEIQSGNVSSLDLNNIELLIGSRNNNGSVDREYAGKLVYHLIVGGGIDIAGLELRFNKFLKAKGII